ncbi:MAG: tol-pal system-associated acyl-CoA thioesterase [Alphaproteobacteria bacterium]|nr:tol-pal system-associated acyl-CoA thioesterase [Alphaproteobacteria bacterium]
MAEPRTAERRTDGAQAAGGTGADVHVFPLRVYYEDTDAGGVVYHANYLRFAERARSEMLRAAGVTNVELMAREGLAFTIRRCEVDFLKPARLDDVLEVHTRVLALKGARVEAEQVVRRDGDDLARLKLEIACIDRAGRPARLPAVLTGALAAAPQAG